MTTTAITDSNLKHVQAALENVLQNTFMVGMMKRKKYSSLKLLNV